MLLSSSVTYVRVLMLGLAAAGVAALTLAVGAPATPVVPGQKQALLAVKRAAATGKIDAAAAASYRAEIRRAASLARGLPPDRGGRIVVALSEISPFVGKLTAPRAAALFGELKANNDYFAKHWPPAPKTDIVDADGSSTATSPAAASSSTRSPKFGALNARIAANDAAATQLLADALDRSRRSTGRAGASPGSTTSRSPAAGPAGRRAWRRRSRRRRSRARRRSSRSGRPPMTARRAPHMPRSRGSLLTSVAAGPWIRLYSFRRRPC